MNTTTFAVIAIAVAAAGTMGIIAGGAPAAEAQERAPGQTGCNPGHSDDLTGNFGCGLPPGQTLANNPGQCQKTSIDDGFPKEIAHKICQLND